MPGSCLWPSTGTGPQFQRFVQERAERLRAAGKPVDRYVDAIGACFEAKYHYQTWRPASAIQMADVDGNDATQVDAAWTPALPTPNHPEYPAAHSCTSGSLGEALRGYYGTPNVTFTWDSKVTGTTRTYTHIDAFNLEAGMARIHGGMHFGFATAAGEELGRRVAQWVAARHFGRQD